jgi:hypothetical protein
MKYHRDSFFSTVFFDDNTIISINQVILACFGIIYTISGNNHIIACPGREVKCRYAPIYTFDYMISAHYDPQL